MDVVCLISTDVFEVDSTRTIKWFLTKRTFYFPGYTRSYLLLNDFLSKQEFADKIQVVGKKDKEMTGNFEVTIGDEGQLIHSKKTAGQGLAKTDQEKAMIVEMIEEYLDDNL